jgi:hypothetical protein
MKKLILKKPVVVGEKGAPVTELNFREEVVAGDLRGLKLSGSGLSTDDLLKISGRLCAQPDPVMNGLSIPDMTAVFDLVGDFLNDGHTTGDEASQS